MGERGFEEALKELEEIVGRLEMGDLPLEEALKLFEEGVKLSRYCHGKLDEAQKRVDMLLSEDGETMVPKAFELEEGETE